MTLVSRIAIASVAVVAICGAAITWHFAKAKATVRKLVEQANACRTQAEQGDADAEYQLARLYFQGKGVPKSYSDAANWYRKAAEQGNKKGEYGIGYMYYWGLGVQQDYEQAFQWYGKAADQGYAKAQYDLSYLYKKGEGVPKDVPKALIWCRKAADQGYPEAEYVLGNTYFDGKYLPQDYSESALWYIKAADQSYPPAETNLGYMYYQGLGVRQDYAQAARWYRKAAKQGDDYARRALRSMGMPFGPFSKICLGVGILGSAILLLGSRGGSRNRHRWTMLFAGLLGLLLVGVDLYGRFEFGTLLAFSAVKPFHFAKGILSGIGIAVLARIVWRRGFKIVLAIVGTGFVGFNIYAAARYDFKYLAACPPAFYYTNGWLIGTAIALMILRWVQREPTQTPGDNQGLAAGAQPLGM